MAYGDSQYSSAPLQFGNLSPIVEAALQRRKQQQQQQAQMLQAMAKMASQPRQQPSVATPPSNLNMSDAMAGAPPVDITSNDPAQLRITAYGPSISNPTSADYNETIGSHDNVLQPGDVAVSPDLRSRFPIGSRIRIGNDWQAYTVNDFTNPRLHNRVDIWNGQDMGTQPVQSFASGGVASFTDPYGERKSQYAEHLGPMADVSGIVGVIARQRQFQQEMQQEQMKQAYEQATKLMEQQRNDAIGKTLLQNDPETANDPLAAQLVASGAHPIDAYKLRKQQISDESDAQRQATKDWYGYAQADKNLYGDQNPNSSGPQTVWKDGILWRQGAGGHWFPTKPADTPESQQSKALKQQYGPSTVPEDFNPDTSTIVPAAGSPAQQTLGVADPTFDQPSTVVTGTGRKMALGTFQKGANQLHPQTGLPNPQTAAPAATAPPAAAIELLKQRPELADQFDAKYGSGLSAQILGK